MEEGIFKLYWLPVLSGRDFPLPNFSQALAKALINPKASFFFRMLELNESNPAV